MPSQSRMIQLYLSKQADIIDIVPQEWVPTAKAFYLRALRKASQMRRHTTQRNSSRKSPGVKSQREKKLRKKADLAAVDLFASAPEGGSPAQGPGDPSEPEDAVLKEVREWAALPQAEIAAHTRGSLVDEFSLLSSLKSKFPLHHTVFMQVSSDLPHEGNAKNIFSGAKHRSDPNMQPSMLRLLTKTTANKSKYKPSASTIWARYQEKYKGLSCYVNDESSDDSGSASSSSDDE